jgi:hypothetical protein
MSIGLKTLAATPIILVLLIVVDGSILAQYAGRNNGTIHMSSNLALVAPRAWYGRCICGDMIVEFASHIPLKGKFRFIGL